MKRKRYKGTCTVKRPASLRITSFGDVHPFKRLVTPGTAESNYDEKFRNVRKETKTTRLKNQEGK
jgi:hypothetical protein